MQKTCNSFKACIMLHNSLLRSEFDAIWVEEKYPLIDDDAELNTSIADIVFAPHNIRIAHILRYLGELELTNIK